MDPRDRTAARDRLLDAAERLFAQKGVAETSVRTITSAAGMNVAAVNYYFASKDHLFDAVIDRRIPGVIAQREAELAAAEPTVESILRAWIEPSLRFGFDHPDFARLASRLRFEEDPGRWQSYRARQADLIARYVQALGKALPHLDDSEINRRFLFLLGTIGHLWAQMPPANGETAEEMTRRLVVFFTAGLQAPAP